MPHSKLTLYWLSICLIPLLSIAYILLNPAQTSSKHLLHGVVLACECVFLFKFVLFKTISAHLQKQFLLKKQLMQLFVPLILLALYICHHFGLF